MRALALLTASLLLGACGKPKRVAAASSGQKPEIGDSNGDGAVDLSDGIYLLHHLMAGGPRAVCWGAADVIQDGRVELGDAFAVWYHLFAGNTVFPEINADKCTAWDTLADPEEGRFALRLDAPKKATARGGKVSFQATVLLESPDLAVEGWSLGVHAEGCSVVGATTQGTAGADKRDDPPGSGDAGFDRTELTGEGDAVSAVVLGWLVPTALAPSEDAVALLILDVEGDAPASGCEPCTLTLEDGLRAEGEPVINLLSVGGRSYHPALPDARTKLCAD